MRKYYSKRQSQRKNLASFIMHLGMGLVYVAVGILLWFIPSIASNWDFQFKALFSGICSIYGIFRIYRAYQALRHKI